MTITDLHQIKASAVPAVPKQITASQRLRALEAASSNQDYAEEYAHLPPAIRNLLLGNARLLRELAQ